MSSEESIMLFAVAAALLLISGGDNHTVTHANNGNVNVDGERSKRKVLLNPSDKKIANPQTDVCLQKNDS